MRYIILALVLTVTGVGCAGAFTNPCDKYAEKPELQLQCEKNRSQALQNAAQSMQNASQAMQPRQPSNDNSSLNNFMNSRKRCTTTQWGSQYNTECN